MNSIEPFGLPRGSVRAALTVVIVAGVVVAVLLGRDPSLLLALAGAALREYFGVRTEQNRQDGPQLEPPALN